MDMDQESLMLDGVLVADGATVPAAAPVGEGSPSAPDGPAPSVRRVRTRRAAAAAEPAAVTDESEAPGAAAVPDPAEAAVAAEPGPVEASGAEGSGATGHSEPGGRSRRGGGARRVRIDEYVGTAKDLRVRRGSVWYALAPDRDGAYEVSLEDGGRAVAGRFHLKRSVAPAGVVVAEGYQSESDLGVQQPGEDGLSYLYRLRQNRLIGQGMVHTVEKLPTRYHQRVWKYAEGGVSFLA